MDQSLFKKHTNSLENRKNNKQEIISYIEQQTGVLLEEKNISISKKTITFHISSVVKQKLFQNKIEKLLLVKGFTLC